MKKSIVQLILLFLLFNNCICFPNSNPFNKKIRINFKVIKRKSYKSIIKRVQAVSENQEEIVDKTVSIFYDNMLTDLLAVAKLYNIINDETKSYYYILLYEFLWFAFKVLKKNSNNKLFELEDENSQYLFDQLIINVILYVSIKNIIFQNVINIIGIIN